MNQPVNPPRIPPARLLHGSRKQQRGAVLYVTLIMLILMALLGIVGMQVVGLQEKMAANFRAANMAFQNAERTARDVEFACEGSIDCGSPSMPADCGATFDAGAWAKLRKYSDGPTWYVREIGKCTYQGALDMGLPENEKPNPIYQVTAYNTDRKLDDNPSSDAVIDTIFRP